MTGPKTRSGTTVDDLYLVLQQRIIDGTYQPGLRMSQEQLAAEHQVSRTPLREALQRLEVDGLVVSHANRGMHVAPIVNSETEQNYALRVLVEPPTIAAVSAKLSSGDIADMENILEEMQRHRAHSRRFQDAHQRFHEVALRRYPENFRQLTNQLHMRIYRHQSVYLSHQRTPDDFIDVDGDLLNAIKIGDSGRVRRIMEFHLIDAALGLVLDADPDHCFDSLLVALHGRQIEIRHHPDGRIDRPAEIRWTSGEQVDVPDRVTQNLVLRPPF
ncbi:GntR family transcriptional regulator [Rhodococcus sp. As11]|uniref:GntR family transcriptional regulator n=1 Tax=Rhodococcus sp. As11 TaxID=3029189 RepID=UPI003B814D22